ncbi:hypothetical protein, no similarity [Maudiozyma barnettii]|uniref:Uncharacterized protein n=1 Tax=Maudiozyma barnettii TaxID=61262 RepID=A0A8H2VEL1_9SACH|nr:hypothetical protein, no similarity [Kazachstania barnettii]CAB4254164.1 hypothetical protein, no similarity [Kazachstania barnettii]CAD1781914.1 hypothetical protein, no similarity [Kazachstania barnettii]
MFTFSKLNFKTIALLSILSTALTYPLLKRDTIKLGNTGWYFDLTATDISNWAGSVQTLCTNADPLVCLGESVVATVLTGISAIGKGTPPVDVTPTVTTVTINAAATATVAVDNTDNGPVVNGIISDGINVVTDVASILNDAGITLLGLYNPTAADLVTSVESLVGGIIHFETNVGTHIAAQIGSTNFTKLAAEISSITPGIPVFKEAEDGVKNVVNWISYVVKEGETDIGTIINELENFDVTKLVSQVSSFIKGVEDYKFCLSPSVIANGTYGPTTHLFGEVYFNSYGMLELECQ